MSKYLNTMRKIWVTQTHPRGHDSASDFETMGLAAVSYPLLNIEFSGAKIDTPDPATHLIFTARNGVRAFVDKHTERDYNVTCVGDATAALAKQYGFNHITSAGGDANSVIEHILKTIPKSVPLRHCAGRHVRGDITETLSALGYTAERVEYYASKPITDVGIDISEFGYVAFYSPLGARTFHELFKDKDVSGLKALSISAATDEALEGLSLKARLVAESPNQHAMMARLKLDLESD